MEACSGAIAGAGLVRILAASRLAHHCVKEGSDISMVSVHTSVIPVRWSDFDRYGHVMNSYYLEYAQEARSDFADEVFHSKGVKLHAFVRHISAEYTSPIGPDTTAVTVESQVSRIGNTSFVTRQSIKDKFGTTACVVETTQVAIDLGLHTPRPLTTREREILASYYVDGAES